LDEAIWIGEKEETKLADFCKACPVPFTSVTCEGGDTVIAQEGWWLVEEEEEQDKDANLSRRSFATMAKKYKTYQCEPGFCLRNNTCANGRSGVACGSCPDGSVLQVGICMQCPDYSPDSLLLWRVIFSVVGALVVAIVWFLLAWAPVFGKTAEEYFMKWFAYPMRIFNRLSKLRARSKKAIKKAKSFQKFFSNPKNVKLFQQYLKVFIAYCQVLGSFVTFKVVYACAFRTV